MLQAKSCYLRSDDESLRTVHLPDQKAVIVGRTPETNIRDTQCSRQQVRLYANYNERKVVVQPIGQRCCGFNGFRMKKDTKYIGSHGDRLEVLYGKHIYEIEFNPSPPKASLPRKRSREFEHDQLSDATKDASHKVAKIQVDVADDTGRQEEQLPETKRVRNNASILTFLNRSKMNSDEQTGQDTWESKDNGALLIYTSRGVQARSKIAAYDMDGTLIKTRSGLVFPKDYDDWQLLYPDLPEKLKRFHNDSYKIVVFTNQASIGSGRINADSFMKKLRNIVNKIGIPMQIFVATRHDIYRKPAPGMWQTLQQYNDSIAIDKNSSFYVGDAAGRAKNWAPGRKKDYSAMDLLLALNLALKFYTPEEHFRGHPQAPRTLPTFDPKNLPTKQICTGSNITSSKQEIVLMVGCPGSGKSHFARNYFSRYKCVNRDSLGNWQACISVLEKHVSENSSVVVDNTNPDCLSRQRYIQIGKRYNVSVRCFVMSTSIEHAKHNNKFRELTDPSHAKIGEAVINSYVKNYEPPTLEEGFAEIVHINFVPVFQKEEHRQLYEMYLLEN